MITKGSQQKQETIVAKKPTEKRAPAVKKTAKATPTISKPTTRQKNAFEENFGEGTAFDLDYGKLLIIALCIYIAVKVS